MRRVILIAIANAAILIAAMVTGLILPGGIGIFGALAAMMLMLAVTLMIALAPAPRAPSPAKLAQVDIKALPAQTERWLEAQRPACPPRPSIWSTGSASGWKPCRRSLPPSTTTRSRRWRSAA